MIKETSRRKNSSLSRKRSSSNATNIFAESAKENIFSRKYFARLAQIEFFSSHKQTKVFRKMIHFQLAKFFSRLPTNSVHTKAIVTRRCHNHVLGTFSHKKSFCLKRVFFRANDLRDSCKSFQKVNLRESHK